MSTTTRLIDPLLLAIIVVVNDVLLIDEVSEAIVIQSVSDG